MFLNILINIFSKKGLLITGILFTLLAAVITIGSYFPELLPKSTSVSSVEASEDDSAGNNRVLIKNDERGFAIWKQGSCLIAKDLSTAHLTQMNKNLSQFKDDLKAEYGFKCVLVE